MGKVKEVLNEMIEYYEAEIQPEDDILARWIEELKKAVG